MAFTGLIPYLIVTESLGPASFGVKQEWLPSVRTRAQSGNLARRTAAIREQTNNCRELVFGDEVSGSEWLVHPFAQILHGRDDLDSHWLDLVFPVTVFSEENVSIAPLLFYWYFLSTARDL